MSGTRFSIEIQPVLPKRLRRLEELANDLYYSWDRGARGLFRHLDPDCWNASLRHPKVFLRRVPQHKLDAAARDPMFLTEYRRVLTGYDTYLGQKPHKLFEKFIHPSQDLIAYFCAEFGFHQSLPIYAGGLGILAGDYCKAMSHLRVPFVGVGLLYEKGYFTQRLDCDGTQLAEYPDVPTEDMPVAPALDAEGNELRVYVDFPSRRVDLKIWEAKVGHIRLYLLDTDLPSNSDEDRAATDQLYGGEANTRIQQEIVLGIGGVRALRALGLSPTVWHINEGHAAFQILERCREYTSRQMGFDVALEAVAANTVFTTHTPVPAGHDIFDHHLIDTYLTDLGKQLGIDASGLLGLGANPGNPGGFNMTSLALRGSRFHNGVSRIHGTVAAEMESYLWPQVPPGENPIGYVTNGIDVSTFLGLAWGSLFDTYAKSGWRARLSDPKFWGKFIDDLPNHAYHSAHQTAKAEMLEDCRHRARLQYRRSSCGESVLARITEYLSQQRVDTLVIGFARRFATYKRATLLFRDPERLARLVNDPDRPVIFIFAGKAHPLDEPGQQLLRQVADIAMRPEFLGRIVLLEDYNFQLARRLMPGVDVWLNVPEYPKEACGTSGMKAAINGALNLSVLDGWWGEGYSGDNGFAITPHPELDPERRNALEAEELMNILEHQVIPLYFARNSGGQPEAWIERSKASMKSALSQFNSQRMALDYLRDFYAPASIQGRLLSQDDAAGARELATWKKKVATTWPGVRASLVGAPPARVNAGEPIPLVVSVSLNGLEPEEVVVECLLGRESELGEFVPTNAFTFQPAGSTDGGATLYSGDLQAGEPGMTLEGLEHYQIRLFPWHRFLSHRFEHGCMLWL
jgi:starch phosphorylase